MFLLGMFVLLWLQADAMDEQPERKRSQLACRLDRDEDWIYDVQKSNTANRSK